MEKLYRNKALSSERVKEVAHREIQTREQFNGKRLSDSQREQIRRDVIHSAKTVDKNPSNIGRR